jgi:hypothetical protein
MIFMMGFSDALNQLHSIMAHRQRSSDSAAIDGSDAGHMRIDQPLEEQLQRELYQPGVVPSGGN